MDRYTDLHTEAYERSSHAYSFKQDQSLEQRSQELLLAQLERMCNTQLTKASTDEDALLHIDYWTTHTPPRGIQVKSHFRPFADIWFQESKMCGKAQRLLYCHYHHRMIYVINFNRLRDTWSTFKELYKLHPKYDDHPHGIEIKQTCGTSKVGYPIRIADIYKHSKIIMSEHPFDDAYEPFIERWLK